MAQIYVKHLTAELIQLNDKTIDDITTHINNITHKQATNCTKVSQNGFILSYQEDQDINCIFTPRNLSLLYEENLMVQLANSTQQNRDIFLKNIPSYIYTKPDEQIVSEIEEKNNIKLLHLNKFQHVATNTATISYFVITLDSKHDRDRIVANRTIKLFGTQQEAQPKQRKNSHRPSSQHPGQALTSNISATVRQQNLPTPTRPSRPQQQIPASNTRTTTNTQYQETAPGLNQPMIDASLKSIIETASTVSKELSSGLESPELYLTILNEVLQHKGIDPVHIPKNSSTTI